MSTQRWHREKLLRLFCYTLLLSLSFSLSLPSLSLSLSPSGVPKFFQLRIIIFPGMSRRCFPTPSSVSLISRKFFSRFPLENTAALARAPPLPHPFPGSSTQKNFNSAPEKSRMTACFFSVLTLSTTDSALQRDRASDAYLGCEKRSQIMIANKKIRRKLLWCAREKNLFRIVLPSDEKLFYIYPTEREK